MKPRILLSYWYYKDADLFRVFDKYFGNTKMDVFADSGGFSAMTQGAEIDINEYGQWIKKYSDIFTVYANLDVIGNAEETLENQKILENMGLAPLPVFHTGEDWSVLEYYINNYQYIGLGGMVPYMRREKTIMPWIIKAFRMAKGKSVYHGLGATSWSVMSKLPWYSVDSSSWGAGFRYGRVPLFDDIKGRFYHAKLGDRGSCLQYGYLFNRYGFDPMDFADRDRNNRATICAVSALSYYKAEEWLRERWGEVKMPGHNKQGLNVYIVDGSIGNLGDAVNGIKIYLSDTTPDLRDLVTVDNYTNPETGNRK
jgi:hypothetical protein